MMNNIRLREADNIVVATSALAVGDLLDGLAVNVLDPIDAGHKVAVRDIDAGDPVIKYGQSIGHAKVSIAAGRHVHDHNLAFLDDGRRHEFSTNVVYPDRPATPRTFDGFVRNDERGRCVATRNYIGIVTTVNCAASVARAIATRMDQEAGSSFANVDGVVAITHGGGCAVDGEGEGLKVLQRTLAGMIAHPNFSHVLLLGLGCETNQTDHLVTAAQIELGGRVRSLSIQEAGGTGPAIEAGCTVIREWLTVADACRREPVALSDLVVGLQCGGSDGLSGITANPALGVAADLIVAHGGTVVLSETPEVFGAEHLLTARAVSPEIGEALLERIEWWKAHARSQGASLDNNPSHGNRRGGLTTILEKSLGAVAKAGTSPLTAVYQYAEAISQRGFVFMDSPGYDPMSATGQIASGANMVCFTTGRGSVFGSKPAPCLKLATNTQLYERMQGDMDINCGDVVSEGVSLASKGEEIFELILAAASGAQTKSEVLGMGDNEFVPWSPGAVL